MHLLQIRIKLQSAFSTQPKPQFTVCFQLRSTHWQPSGSFRGSLVCECMRLLFYSTQQRSFHRSVENSQTPHRHYFLSSVYDTVKRMILNNPMSDSGNLTHYFVPAVLSLQRIQYIPVLFRGVTRLCLPAVPVNSRLDSTSERETDTAGEQRGKAL